ncbi:hypothetical protein RHGRI_023405 [Rhododendron griersonianum]|uniref:Red chlorophyll catabolite reductase n=1 Tax=Rhododendron griersonianum TaxID=479676 RepID=A0AAV6J7B1_9ERIC|nr:hypothetical protein RHGRI_023405 [Rhododendron griersonianum]
MAVISAPSLHSSFSTSPLLLRSPFPSPPPPRSKLAPISCSPSSSSSPSPLMAPQSEDGRKRFMEFPYVSAPHRDLMVDLFSTMESRLGSYLLPCTLPPDVQYYHNEGGTALASLHVRSGLKPSPIDFILGSWLHCELPSGALNITSLSAYLSPSTDAPNFLMELIQSSPTSLVLILDLPPRKDLVLHPEYLQTFYEDTQIDEYRKILEKIPEVRPYSSSSLYIRCVVSPTAILVCIETEPGRTERMEEIVRDHVSAIAKEVLGIWLDRCACGGREMGETDRVHLAKRDRVFKSKTIEIDLGSSLPRLFGQEVATRVLGAMREVFSI